MPWGGRAPATSNSTKVVAIWIGVIFLIFLTIVLILADQSLVLARLLEPNILVSLARGVNYPVFGGHIFKAGHSSVTARLLGPLPPIPSAPHVYC